MLLFENMIYVLSFVSFFILMLVYFRIADKYNIIDKPNERSSHTQVTIRGGGVIFLIAIITAGLIHLDYWLPVLGAAIIGVISFMDDRMTLSSRIRIIFHLIAVTLMFCFLPVFGILPWWTVAGLYILVIGIINAYNFMDGINGITGLYSLTVLGGLQYVNLYHTSFIEQDLIWLPMLACLVFLYFNFRKRAKCFAGDVGSVSIAFWIVFLLLTLMLSTGNYTYLLFLTVYGVDAVLTIIHRLKLKQNIFDAHRLHFYQILANEQKWPQLLVSSMYALIQLIIILVVIFVPLEFTAMYFIAVLPLVIIYIGFKPGLMSKKSVR